MIKHETKNENEKNVSDQPQRLTIVRTLSDVDHVDRDWYLKTNSFETKIFTPNFKTVIYLSMFYYFPQILQFFSPL